MATLMRQTGLPHEIHGQIRDEAALTKLYAQADVLLTCSNEDNWPNILVEAGAHGCMPIVGPGHGCEEFVRLYQFGEVAKSYTPEAFATVITQALDGLTAEKAAHAVERVRADHHPQTVAKAMSDIVWTMDQMRRPLHSVPA
jgi:glycosyltransferase involved in cell wall biosynthesis